MYIKPLAVDLVKIQIVAWLVSETGRKSGRFFRLYIFDDGGVLLVMWVSRR